jgi:DNA gyrase/topoisomerase IV subunit A
MENLSNSSKNQTNGNNLSLIPGSIDDINMIDLAVSQYKGYGMYVITSKMIPSALDGLIPVQRRLLLSCHYNCKNEYIRTAAIIGDTMAKWHPHQLSEDTVNTLVMNNFVDGSGLWGSGIGTNPSGCAAMRYTKVKANEFIERISMEYINDVPWYSGDNNMKEEPIYLPTMIPFCLISKFEKSKPAFGIKSVIPCYTHKDLIIRLMSLLKGKDKGYIIKPMVFGCNVIDGEFEKILTKGTGEIKIRGRYTIDEDNKTIIVNGWSPRFTFETLLSRIDKYNDYNLLSNNEIGYADRTGNGIDETVVVFSVAKQRNTDEIFTKMKNAIISSLESVLLYNIYAVNESSNVEITPVDTMLMNAYSKFKEAQKVNIIKKIDEFKKKIDEIAVIRLIIPHISTLTLELSFSEKVDILSKKTNIDPKRIETICAKYSIKQLLSIGTDTNDIINEVSRLEQIVESDVSMTNKCITDYQTIFKFITKNTNEQKP